MVTDIRQHGSLPNIGSRNSNSGQASATENKTRGESTEIAPPAENQVELSSQANTLKAAEDAIGKLPDVDLERVAKIKAALENNTLPIDNKSIADKMLAADHLLG